MRRTYTVLVLAVLLAVTGVAVPADQPRRVLMLHSFGQRIAPFDALSGPFRQRLGRASPEPLAITEVSIDAARVVGPDSESATLEYLRALYPNAAPDLLVAIGGPAAHFVQAHRAELFPAAPALITATEARRIDPAALTDRDVGALHVIDVPGMMRMILEVQPGTRDVLVVLGASPLERMWRAFAEHDLAAFAGRVDFAWTTDLDFDAILARVAALPPDAAVIYGLMIVDGAGVPFEEDQAITAISAASAVPVYGFYDSQLGKGLAGGRLLPVGEMAANSAGAALRLLAGELPSDVSVPVVGAGPPTFDSRQLVRFGIAEDSLPPGSRVLFREPTSWDRYRWPILAALALGLLQSAFIAGLYLSRRRLSRSEAALTASEGRLREAAAEARDFAGRLIRAQEDERARLGRELHDDITQRLAVMAIDVGRCERQATDAGGAISLGEVREGLAHLSSDVHALSYQLHPSILADLGLVAALETEAERVARIDGLPVSLVAEGVPETVPRPVALCLYRVTQEALRNLVRHAGATRGRVTLAAESDSIRLTVEDDGHGFDPDAARKRPSLGLASMRQRVAAVGGTVHIDAAPGRGTRVEVVLPLGGTDDDPAAASAR